MNEFKATVTKDMISLYPPERKPMSRKKRRKARRFQAFIWHSKKEFRRNPIVGTEIKHDSDTGFDLIEHIHANGDRFVEIISVTCGVCVGDFPALFRLTSQ